MVKIPILQAMAWLEKYEADAVARWRKLKELLELQTRVAEQRDAPVQPEQNGASLQLVATYDNDGGGIDIDVLREMLKGKHGWLMAKPYANGQMQLFMEPHSKRSGGG